MKLSIQILVAFSIVLLLSIADTTSNYLLSLKVKENTEFFNKSQDIIRNSGKIHKTIIEMQSAFRGFLLTNDTSFLGSYYNGIKNIPVLYTEQKELIKENVFQLSTLDSIYQFHQEWIHYTDSLIGVKKNARFERDSAAVSIRLFETILKKRTGKKVNDEITSKFLAFDKSEYKLRSVHGGNLISSIQTTHAFSGIFFALTIIIGIFSTMYIIRIISKRIKTMVNLAEDISRGNFTTLNDTHRDELTGLSTSLNSMSDSLSKNITELEKRNRELDQFAYVVSHDLKAPIRGIHNVVKWIEEDLGQELSPEMKKYLNIIPERTKRMEDLINGLLDYARVSKKTPFEETNVNELVKKIVEEVVPRNFKIEMNHLPVLHTERIKLGQVFTNLLSNSVKYSVNGNGHIIISCKEHASSYEFSVKDNGIGIEPEYHEKIFQIFQTLREKDEKESTGIGLAIVKKIIDEQHGTIKVNSKLSEGAEFIFTWPKNNQS